MKARSRKRALEQRFSKASVIQKPTPVVQKPKVCPFSHAVQGLLMKDIQPITEIVDDLEVLQKKPRGRPRKYFPNAEIREDKLTHKIEDEDSILPKSIQKDTLKMMVKDFRHHYIVNQIPLQRSLERICQSYKITYKQAHTMLHEEF